MTKISAVIVTYNPDIGRLAAELEALHRQVDQIFIFDNCSSPDRHPRLALSSDLNSIVVLDNSLNKGLGAALNAGAEMALAQGATHLLFLDQDSVPGVDMVRRLAAAIAAADVGQLAAVGPAWVDARTRARNIPERESPGTSRDTNFLITSGLLMPSEVYRTVGPFDEGLFVDSTDREWCFRAKFLGYGLRAVESAIMTHQLGDQPLRLFGKVLGGWTRHSPQRLYYMMRNRVILYRRSYVPLSWKITDVVRATGKFVAFSLLIPPRWKNFNYMVLGVRDGLRHVSGPLREVQA